MGQGLHTKMVQVAAQTLDISLNKGSFQLILFSLESRETFAETNALKACLRST